MEWVGGVLGKFPEVRHTPHHKGTSVDLMRGAGRASDPCAHVWYHGRVGTGVGGRPGALSEEEVGLEWVWGGTGHVVTGPPCHGVVLAI